MRSDLERIQDMQESIDNIERYTARGKNAFFEDELIQTWVLYHLQILGEAARSMSQDLRDRHPEVPWKSVIDFRNFAVHEYFRINLKVIWRIVEKDLPLLKSQLELIVANNS